MTQDTLASNDGLTSRPRRLSAVAAGQRVRIAHTRDPNAGHRMVLLGLIDGIEIDVETRGRHGDLVIAFDRKRFFIPYPIADRIWVLPIAGD